jgi:hypothetical protein
MGGGGKAVTLRGGGFNRRGGYSRLLGNYTEGCVVAVVLICNLGFARLLFT